MPLAALEPATDLPHGVLFWGGAEEPIRTKLLKDGHIDTVIGLPAKLFYSTRILVLKKCKRPDDVLFINAAEQFVKGKCQNQLTNERVSKIMDAYQFRREEKRYSKCIGQERIAQEGDNLNVSRCIGTATVDQEIDLSVVNTKLTGVEEKIKDVKDTQCISEGAGPAALTLRMWAVRKY